MAKLFSFVLPLDIYSLGLIAMVEEGYNHRDYGEHVASKFDVENTKSAYSVDPPSDFPNYAGDTRRAEAAQRLFARQRHQWLLPTEFVGHYLTGKETSDDPTKYPARQDPGDSRSRHIESDALV